MFTLQAFKVVLYQFSH